MHSLCRDRWGQRPTPHWLHVTMPQFMRTQPSDSNLLHTVRGLRHKRIPYRACGMGE